MSDPTRRIFCSPSLRRFLHQLVFRGDSSHILLPSTRSLVIHNVPDRICTPASAGKGQPRWAEPPVNRRHMI